jgi:hypothetical protein
LRTGRPDGEVAGWRWALAAVPVLLLCGRRVHGLFRGRQIPALVRARMRQRYHAAKILRSK